MQRPLSKLKLHSLSPISHLVVCRLAIRRSTSATTAHHRARAMESARRRAKLGAHAMFAAVVPPKLALERLSRPLIGLARVANVKISAGMLFTQTNTLMTYSATAPSFSLQARSSLSSFWPLDLCPCSTALVTRVYQALSWQQLCLRNAIKELESLFLRDLSMDFSHEDWLRPYPFLQDVAST